MAKISLIGGQAVMEGVMMRGNNKMAMAVRKPDGGISLKRYNTKKYKTSKIPFVRGVLNFVSMMRIGVEVLLNSAEIAEDGITEEPTKFEKWISKKTGKDSTDVMLGMAVVLGLGFSILLFIILPNLLANGLALFIESPFLINIGEGVIRIAIFLGYLAVVSLVPDMKRFFAYHGAEHKTINCYEQGLEITPENAKKMTTKHPRCGTSFMLLVLVISIIMFTLTGWQGGVIGRVLIRLALLPVVASISYEMLMSMAKHENIFVRIIRWPGMQLQRMTTNEPDLDMLEVAIAAFAACMPDYEIKERMPEGYRIPGDTITVGAAYEIGLEKLQNANIDNAENAAKWLVLGTLSAKSKSFDITKTVKILEKREKLFNTYIDRHIQGEPVQYILGNWEFGDLKLKVDQRALIPRPETELLADYAVNSLLEDSVKSVIDIGCGSGCIGLYIKSKRPNIKLTLADNSEGALELAGENAEANNVDCTLVGYDMTTALVDIYDLIISNPPYIPTGDLDNLAESVKEHEPMSALDGGDDGLDFYRQLVKRADESLTPDGSIMLEVGIGQAQDVSDLFSKDRYTVTIEKDLAGIDRMVIATRIEDDL